MDWRRNSSTEYYGARESYRPSYEPRRASSPRRTSPSRRVSLTPQPRGEDYEGSIPKGPRRDRPDPSSRSTSYAGSVQYYPQKIVQTDGATRSPNTTPAESPRSPMVINPGENLTNANRSSDPRHLKKASRPANVANVDVLATYGAMNPSVTAALGQPHAAGQAETVATAPQPTKAEAGDNAVNQWLRENIRRAVLEDRLERIEDDLHQARAEEQDQKTRFPDYRAMHEQISTRCNKFEVKASKLSARIQESVAKESKIVGSMTEQQRQFLTGVIPDSRPASSAQDSGAIRKMQEMESKIRSQELELQHVKRCANDAKVQEQIDAFDCKLDTQDQRFLACDRKVKGQGQQIDLNNRSINAHKEAISAHAQKLQAQDQRFDTCEQKIKGHGQQIEHNNKSIQAHEESLNAQRQLISDLDLELKSSAAAKGESGCGIPELRAEIRRHNFQFAKLSSVFASQEDHEELSGAVEQLKASNSKFQADVAKIKTDVDLVGVANTNTVAEIEQLKTSMVGSENDLLQTIRLSARTQDEAAPVQLPTEDIKQFKADVGQVQSDVATLKASLAELKSNYASLSGPDILGLQSKVAKLLSFEGHYEKFYKDTETRLKANEDWTNIHDGALQRLGDQYSSLDNKHNAAREVARTESTSNHQAIASLRRQLQTLQDASHFRPANLQDEVTNRLTNVEKQYNDYTKAVDATIKQNITSAAKAYFDVLKQQFDALTPLVQRNENSIKALDTRWNAISTAHLHKSIINSLVPLGPLCDQVREDHARLLRQVNDIQNGCAQLQNEISVLKSESGRQGSGFDTALQIAVDNLKVRLDSMAETDQHGSPAWLQEKYDQVQQQVDKLRDQFETTSVYANQVNDMAAILATVEKMQEQVHAIQSRQADDRVAMRQLSESTNELRPSIVKAENKVDGLQDRLSRCEEQIPTMTEKLPAIRGDIVDIQKQLRTFDNVETTFATLRDQINALLPRDPTDISDKLHEFQGAIGSLQTRIDELKESSLITNTATTVQNLGLYPNDRQFAMCFHGDSFIKITNLASKVDEDFLKRQFAPIQVRQLWFEGGKDLNTRKTNRYALVQLQTPNPQCIIDKVNALKQLGQSWKGREPTAVEAELPSIKALLLDKPEAQTAGTVLHDGQPVLPQGKTSDRTATIANSNDELGDTVTLNDSSHRTSSQASAPPSSDAYLTMWNARTMPSPLVSKGTPAPKSRTSTPVGSATSSIRGVKRSIEEPERSNNTSRSGLKRARPDS